MLPITVTIDNPKVNRISSVVLTGYAYETVPNKPIIAGQTKGHEGANGDVPSDARTTPAHAPASLGLLALGCWRLAGLKVLVQE